MLNIIKKAISGKSRLVLNYPPGERIIEPHALGYSKDGNILLRAYQVGGASASGEHEHWKLFRIDRITDVRTDYLKFNNPRKGYREGDRAMKGGIITELSADSHKSEVS